MSEPRSPLTLRVARFERRVLGVIMAVAFIPLVGALFLGQAVLSEAYRVGVNGRVRRQLDEGLDAWRQYLVTLRRDADRTADAVAHDYRLVDAIARHDEPDARASMQAALTRYPHVARVEVLLGEEAWSQVERDPIEEEVRTLELRRPLELPRAPGEEEAVGPPAAAPPSIEVRVTIVTPSAPFTDYQRAGEDARVYGHLQDGTSYVSGFYLATYILLLLSVIVVAFAVGLVVSRRVTRRIVVLAEATQRVGRGDLSVEVPTDDADEVGELTRAFNEMVRDIRSSRDRIEYLQRIGAWQEMARRLAHEIKNPLTPIQLAVQEAANAYKGDDARFRRTLGDARDIVEEEVTTLRRLVSEFSEFARLPELAVEDADLAAFVRDAERALDPAAMMPEHAAAVEPPKLELDIQTDPLPVRIDAMMLRRCVDNLVRNATQALAGGGGGGEVIVRVRRDGDDALLEVIDDGPGIPADARERVFDPYFTTKAEGTGLGLAIVKKVVLEHGGAISCDASPHGGATFRIRLPISPASAT